MTTPIGPLGRVILFVDDVEACGAFYRDVLGLVPDETTHDDGKWLDLDSGGCRLALHKKGPAPAGGGGAGEPHKLVFFAADVRAARERLVAAGATMFDLKEFGDLHLCDGADPEGHRFQISNRR